jgi:dinuclear metal center YbgI/SA1388 family protein
MHHRDEIRRHLDELLGIEGIADYGPNGLQVEGRAQVRRVVCGVTASLAFIEQAVARGADLLVVHHGILWNGQSPVLRGSLRRRVAALLAAEVTLLAYHLPLDRHPTVGNAAPALRDLGVVELEPFGSARGVSVGFQGRLAEPLPVAGFVARCERYYEVPARAFLHGPPEVRRVGLVTGAAQSEIHAAVASGLDAFLTGEVSEYNFHVAAEEGIHHISLGHHATERTGPRCLARHLRESCGLDAEFLDVPNPV